MEVEPRSDKETRMIEQLRNAIDDLDLTPDYLEDKNLVRWLRARNHNLKETEQMIRKNIEWIRETGMEKMMDCYSSSEFHEEFLKQFPFNVSGFDYDGSPVCVSPMGGWDLQKAMSLGRKKEYIRFGLFVNERTWRLCKRVSEDKDYVAPFIGIYDFSGLTLRQLTCSDVMDATLTIGKSFEANYPEILKCGFIVNAPWVFQILWKLIRPFMTERTHSKVVFLGSDVQVWRETISKLVPLDQFPQRYGGTADNSAMIEIEKDGTWKRSWNEKTHQIA